MANQVYQIQLHSPMGIKRGLATVQLQEGQIMLDLLGGENSFSGSIVPEYAFQMTGTLKTAVRELPGVLQGVLSQGGLQAVLHTEQGDFPIEGVPEAPSAQQP